MFDTLVKIAHHPDGNPEYLIDLFNAIRPKSNNKAKEVNQKVEEFLLTLEKDEFLRTGFNDYLKKVFTNRRFSTVISEMGIIKNQNFISELKRRIIHKILPIQPSKQSINYLLSNIFYKSTDFKWVNVIKKEHWEKLFRLINFTPLSEKTNDDFAVIEVITAIEILALRISGIGVNEELLKMAPELNKLESPFISLVKETHTMVENIKNGASDRTADSIDIRQIYVIIEQCNEYVEKIVKNRVKYGITFETTVKVARLKQELERLEMILDFLAIDEEGGRYDKSIEFIKKIIEFNCTKNDIRSFINYSSGMVAFQITQHAGKTGEHYITTSKKEYKKMLYSAMGGGTIVAILCLIKVQLSYMDVSPLSQAFLFSMNYAIGFIAIYLMGYTLATKQPAMTAATLAQSIDVNGKKHDYTNFSNLFTRLFRSQYIAFIGNVLMAFPVALILGYAWLFFFGENPVMVYKAKSMLREINPFLSLALFHASIAGFYLFLSGLISGYYINNNIHNQVSYRYRKHPFLRSIFPKTALDAFADFYDKKIGGLAGNFWFGVFLGSTGILGFIIGLPIDIRHITFAAGNFALALVGLEFSVSFWDVFLSVLCIGLIGFCNFIVSFMLSLFLAMRSRKIPMSRLKYMFKAVLEKFYQNRKAFFFPPHDEVMVNEEVNKDI